MYKLTKAEAKEIMKDFVIYPKASENATRGSYYPYMFKCGVYYISESDVETLLTGGKVYGTGVEYLYTCIKNKYPETYKKILNKTKG